MIGALVPTWAKWTAAGALVAVLAGGVWNIRRDGVVAGRAEVQTKWDAEKVALAELARRSIAAKTVANQGVDRDYQATKSRIAADKRITDDRLREYQAAASADTNTTPTCGADDPYRVIANQCAAALGVLDEYAQSVAGKATALQGYAREVCVKN